MIVACTRVKNAERYMARWLKSNLELCDKVFVLDDGSSDLTRSVLERYISMYPDRVFAQFHYNRPFDGGRDWNLLHDDIAKVKPDWVFATDVDEFVQEDDYEAFKKLIVDTPTDIYGWTFPFFYLWNSPDTYRCDTKYNTVHVIRLFRFQEDKRPPQRVSHSQMCCDDLDRRYIRTADARILHYGYMLESDRKQKYDWYTKRDADPQKAGAGDSNYKHLLEDNPPLAKVLSRQDWHKQIQHNLQYVRNHFTKVLT